MTDDTKGVKEQIASVKASIAKMEKTPPSRRAGWHASLLEGYRNDLKTLEEDLKYRKSQEGET